MTILNGYQRIFFLSIIFLFFMGLFVGPQAAPAMAETLKSAGEIVQERKCLRCHTLQGEGGDVGPDLSDVGSRRDAEFIKNKLLHPKALRPGSPMPPFRGTEAELEALVAYLSSLKE